MMINRLLGDWHSRLKYVDGTTDFEVIPRNSEYSLLEFAVRDISSRSEARSAERSEFIILSRAKRARSV